MKTEAQLEYEAVKVHRQELDAALTALTNAQTPDELVDAIVAVSKANNKIASYKVNIAVNKFIEGEP